jgi:5-formyltetrahydrofolate cyclo-ligase
MDTEALRAACKAKRYQLPPATIAELSSEIAAQLWRLPVLARCRRIACYIPVGGEVDCEFAAQVAWNRNREVCLPVIRGRELLFAPYHPNSKFLRNQYGIPEPSAAKREFFRPREIDVVLTPLVAFDGQGNRLGMGAGFYDRSFRFLRGQRQWYRPQLIGLAYEIQKAPKLKACSWDVPLHYAVTEKQVYAFR